MIVRIAGEVVGAFLMADIARVARHLTILSPEMTLAETADLLAEQPGL